MSWCDDEAQEGRWVGGSMDVRGKDRRPCRPRAHRQPEDKD
jgi:hypothetical protein